MKINLDPKLDPERDDIVIAAVDSTGIELSWSWCTIDRLYINFTLMEFLFGLDHSNVCRGIEKIEPLSENACPFLRNCTRLPRG